MIITAETKDKVLAFLVNQPTLEAKGKFTDTAARLGMSASEVQEILNQFERLNLVTVSGDFNADFFKVVVRAEASDHYVRGGFTAREVLYQKELLKLENELEQLKNNLPDKLTLVDTVLGAVGVVKGFF